MKDSISIGVIKSEKVTSLQMQTAKVRVWGIFLAAEGVGDGEVALETHCSDYKTSFILARQPHIATWQR